MFPWVHVGFVGNQDYLGSWQVARVRLVALSVPDGSGCGRRLARIGAASAPCPSRATPTLRVEGVPTSEFLIWLRRSQPSQRSTSGNRWAPTFLTHTPRRGKEARNIAKIAAARELLTLFTTAYATGTSAAPHSRDMLHNLTPVPVLGLDHPLARTGSSAAWDT